MWAEALGLRKATLGCACFFLTVLRRDPSTPIIIPTKDCEHKAGASQILLSATSLRALWPLADEIIPLRGSLRTKRTLELGSYTLYTTKKSDEGV